MHKKNQLKVLGIDIGGSSIKSGVVDVSKGSLCSEPFILENPSDLRPASLLKNIEKIVDYFHWRDMPIGCGFPGVIHNGVVATAHNLHKDWLGLNLEHFLGKFLKCPVWTINDADAAGLAEMQFGNGKDFKEPTCVLTLGTGIGSALFNKGVLFPNLELGHLLLGNKKWEQYAAPSIKEKENLTLETWANRLNEYLSYVYYLFSPSRFIIGGGISSEWDTFSIYLKNEAELMPSFFLNHAGIIGAGILCYNEDFIYG